MPEYQVIHQKADSFYKRYERKAAEQHQTHYCPGCGHGVAHKLLAAAIDELRAKDRTVLVSPVGCGVFAYYYFDVGNIQAAHGRASAVAVGVKRSRPDSLVISYQGDGDLAAIGSAEILHAANRGEPITVIFINNAIYGMTGGQMAPTTVLGQKTTTTPFGRDPYRDGYPLHVCELLASLEAPVYIERVGLGNGKQIMAAGRAIRRALEAQSKGLGFSLIEILSPCPTIWKLKPLEAQRRVREEMAKVFPLGVFRDKTKDAPARPAPQPPARWRPAAPGCCWSTARRSRAKSPARGACPPRSSRRCPAPRPPMSRPSRWTASRCAGAGVGAPASTRPARGASSGAPSSTPGWWTRR